MAVQYTTCLVASIPFRAGVRRRKAPTWSELPPHSQRPIPILTFPFPSLTRGPRRGVWTLLARSVLGPFPVGDPIAFNKTTDSPVPTTCLFHERTISSHNFTASNSTCPSKGSLLDSVQLQGPHHKYQIQHAHHFECSRRRIFWLHGELQALDIRTSLMTHSTATRTCTLPTSYARYPYRILRVLAL